MSAGPTQLWAKRRDGIQSVNDPSVWRIQKVISANSNEAVVQWMRGSSAFPDVESIPSADLCENACELNCLLLQCGYNSSS